MERRVRWGKWDKTHSPFEGQDVAIQSSADNLEILITLSPSSLSPKSFEKKKKKKLSSGVFHVEKLTARRIFRLNHFCHHSVVKYHKTPEQFLFYSVHPLWESSVCEGQTSKEE